MEKVKQKATRVLRNLSFRSPDSNISLVGPEVGSGANQTKVLILKQAVNVDSQTNEEEKQMATANTVTIEKARFSELEGKETELTVAVQKAADLQAQVEALTLQLTKAAEDKAAAEFAAFSESLKDLVEASQLEKVAKSLFTLKGADEEAANIMIETLKAKKAALEQSDLFQEKSHAEEVETQTPEQIRKAALKAEINKPL
jgi:hypothetical protein